MGLNIKDLEVGELAARLARVKRTSKTQAVKDALRAELARAAPKAPLWERIQPILRGIAARPDTGVAVDKSFFDELSGEDQR